MRRRACSRLPIATLRTTHRDHVPRRLPWHVALTTWEALKAVAFITSDVMAATSWTGENLSELVTTGSNASRDALTVANERDVGFVESP